MQLLFFFSILAFYKLLCLTGFRRFTLPKAYTRAGDCCILQDLRPDITEAMVAGLSSMDTAMKKVYEIGGLPHFQALECEVSLITFSQAC
jgi:hypothetical protein